MRIFPGAASRTTTDRESLAVMCRSDPIPGCDKTQTPHNTSGMCTCISMRGETRVFIKSELKLCGGRNNSLCQSSKAPNQYQQVGLRERGILMARKLAHLGVGVALMGPPGAGKSTLVRTAKKYLGAHTTDLEFMNYRSPAAREAMHGLERGNKCRCFPPPPSRYTAVLGSQRGCFAWWPDRRRSPSQT